MRLWHVRLGGHQPESVTAWLAVCQPEERARYHRFAASLPRWRFAQARLAVRLLLGAHAGVPPADVRLDGHDGAPRPHGGPFVNWSRSGDHVLLGVSASGPLGVDIESPSRRGDEAEIVDLLASDGERHLAEDPDGVLRMWTLKESAVKAVGLGLRLDMRSLEVLPHLATGGEAVTLLPGWTTRAVDLGPDAFAAVTARGAEPIALRRVRLPELVAAGALT